MTIDEARTLVARADAHPAEVATIAGDRLAEVPTGAPLDDERAVTAWALGLALRHLRRLDEAKSWLDRATGAMTGGTDDHTRAMMTLTGILAFQGEFERADAALVALQPSPELAPRVAFQRAAIAEHTGNVDAAATGYATALDRFRDNGDRLGEAHALSGLGLVARARGEPDLAFDRYRDARTIYRELELDMLAAVATGNMGWAATRAGNLVVAVDLLEAAAVELREHDEPFIETELDHVEALMLLGRQTEAVARAVAVLGELQSAGASADRAELLVALGGALAATGHADVADQAFAVADRLFTEQGRPAWTQVVRLRRLVAAADRGEDVADAALQLGAGLRAAGLVDAAADADVLALEQLWRDAATGGPTSDADGCEPSIERLRSLPAGDLRRAYGEAVRAVVDDDLIRAGDVVRDAVEAAAGAVDGATSLEVRTALARLRDRITRIGVWAARSRNDAVAVVELLSRLQRLAVHPAGSGVAADGLDRTSVELGGVPASDDVTSSFVSLLDDGAGLVCVRANAGSYEFVDAPDRSVLLDLLVRHHTVLRQAIGGPRSTAMMELLDRSSAAVRTQLPFLEGDGPLSLAVSGELVAAPWTSVASRPVRVVLDMTVGRSATGSTTVLVGPGLATADEEVLRLGEVLGERLTVATGDALAAIASAGGATLHLCCHGHHDPVDPMLSTYELADGRLSARDIEAVATAPSLVVAAACRAGGARAAGLATALGLPTAWLAAGASTVVAPTCAIPDDDRTVATMTELHRALASGASPEEAVWRARSTGDPVVARSLSVIGRPLPVDDDPH